MIYGVSHLQGTVVPPIRAPNARFVEQGVPNDPAKRPFMRRWSDTHDIAYYDERPIAREFVAYPHAGRLVDGYEFLGWGEISVQVADPIASLEWWAEAFGCGTVIGATVVPSPIDRGCRVRFKPAAENRTWYLDDYGYTCLALLSTDVESDMARAAEGARKASDVFTVQVGGRHLAIGLLRGPNGELVELVEVGRVEE